MCREASDLRVEFFDLTLVRGDVSVPPELPYGDGTIVPLRAGEKVRWRVEKEKRL